MKEQLEDFIKNNKLNFNGVGSSLNGNCVILAGYALHIGISDVENVISLVKEVFPKHGIIFESEMKRVFSFANSNHYEVYWKSDEAKKMYKF